LLGMFPAMMIEADAAFELTIDNGNIRLSSSDNNWTQSGANNVSSGQIMGSGNALNCDEAAVTTSLTITNNSGEERVLKFTFNVTKGTGSGAGVTIGRTSYSDGQEYSSTIASGGSVTITVNSGKGQGSTTEVTLSNIRLAGQYTVTFITHASDYTITSEKSKVTDSTKQQTFLSDDGIAVFAPETYVNSAGVTMTFRRWIDSSTGESILGGKDRETTLYPSNGASIIPLYGDTSVETGEYIFQVVGGEKYYTWDSAFAAAGSTGTVILLKTEYMLPKGLTTNGVERNTQYVQQNGDKTVYTVAAGQTFVIPYDATLSTGTADYNKDTSVNACTTPYATLTVPDGCVMNINGTLNVNAKVCAVGYGYSGLPYGTYGKMILGGELNINGTMYARGYVVGTDHDQHENGSGTGNVNVAPQGKVYVPLQIIDHRGGTAANNAKDKMFPMNLFYFQNIMVRTSYESGSSLIGQYLVVAQSIAWPGEVTMVSSGSDALFQMTGTDGSIVFDYQFDGDRTIVNVDSSITMHNISVKVSAFATITTSGKELPLPSHMTVNIDDGGTVTVANDLKLLPGAKINILTGGEMVASGEIYLYSKESYQDTWMDNKNRERRVVPGVIQVVTDETKKDGDAQISVGGKLTMSGYLWESTSHPGGIVGLDGGELILSNAPMAYPENACIYEIAGTDGSNLKQSTSWVPVNGLLAGISSDVNDYRPFSEANAGEGTAVTYNASGAWASDTNAQWYQYKIPVYAVYKDEASETTSEYAYFVNGGSGNEYFKNLGLTETVVGITADNIPTLLYKPAVAVWHGSGTDFFTNLSKAVEVSSDGYIQMVADSTEREFTIDKSVILDLNGCYVDSTVTIASGGALNGMDTATNDCGIGGACGTISSVTIPETGGGTITKVHQSNIAGSNQYKSYVAYQTKDGELSFHRFRLGIPQLTFYGYSDPNATENSARGVLTFQAAILGDEQALDAMTNLGFIVNETNKWYINEEGTAQTTLSTYAPAVPENTKIPNGKVLQGSIVDITDFSTVFDVDVQAEFGEGNTADTTEYDAAKFAPHTPKYSFNTAMKALYMELKAVSAPTAEQSEIISDIEAFARRIGYNLTASQ